MSSPYTSLQLERLDGMNLDYVLDSIATQQKKRRICTSCPKVAPHRQRKRITTNHQVASLLVGLFLIFDSESYCGTIFKRPAFVSFDLNRECIVPRRVQFL
jgi:hypothetical protein